MSRWTSFFALHSECLETWKQILDTEELELHTFVRVVAADASATEMLVRLLAPEISPAQVRHDLREYARSAHLSHQAPYGTMLAVGLATYAMAHPNGTVTPDLYKNYARASQHLHRWFAGKFSQEEQKRHERAVETGRRAVQLAWPDWGHVNIRKAA